MQTQEFIRNRNPMEYLKLFFRRKWFLIIPAFIGCMAGIIACLILPRTYESYTVVLVKEEKILNPLIQGLAVSTNVTQRMQTIKEQLLGWHSLVELTKKLNLAKDIRSQIDFENLILALRRNIQVRMYGPMLIRMSYQSKDPREAQMVVQTLSDILIEENKRTQAEESDVAINFIKEQLQVYKRKIKESEVSGLEEKLQDLLMDSTEQHPMVKNLKEQIAAAKKELDSGEYEVKDSDKPIPSPIYESMKQELEKLTKSGEGIASGATAYAMNSSPDTDDPNATIYKLFLMDKLESAESRDMDVNQNIYNMLLQKLETAKITQRLEASKEGTSYIIIDPPRFPLQPVKPNKIKVIFMGLFLGAFAGSGLVFGREFFDHSFLDIEDARHNLELPILGAISRITTQEEVTKEKIKHKLRFISGILLSLLLVAFSVLVYFFKK